MHLNELPLPFGVLTGFRLLKLSSVYFFRSKVFIKCHQVALPFLPKDGQVAVGKNAKKTDN
jgi:hypothetical protein